MSLPVWGGALAGLAATGLLLVGARLAALRRPLLDRRVLPYLRDLPQVSGSGTARPQAPRSAPAAVFGPPLQSAAATLERVLGGATSVRRRLERAGLPMTVHDFRIQQVTWGLVLFAATAALSAGLALRSPARALPLLVLCLVAFVLGVLVRDNRLSAQVSERERRMLEEFPTVAELLALAVAAGEGPVSALDRVVARCHGELAAELEGVLAAVRTGTPVTRALDARAARTGLPVLARFAEGMAIAIERGTPLADVLHAQAKDVREAARRDLIETGARKEVLMMVPVVFLVLPVTVLFAFWPGVVCLHLVAP
jgi:tight adherence protein C